MWICHVLDMSCLENDPSGLCYAGILIHFRSGENIEQPWDDPKMKKINNHAMGMFSNDWPPGNRG